MPNAVFPAAADLARQGNPSRPSTAVTCNDQRVDDAGEVAALQTPVGVVFDTNVWQRGGLDVSKLRKHAERLEKRGIEVWIPGQVLLEWVEHALSDANALAPVWNRLLAAALLGGPAPVDRDADIVEHRVREQIESIQNVRILEMHGTNAVSAIQDQIRGAGAGGTKKGVKTGAADSSLIRDSLSAADGDPVAVVFVTNNKKDFLNTGRALGTDLRVSSEQDLYRVEIPTSLTRVDTSGWVDPLPSIDKIIELAHQFMDDQRQAAIEADDGHSPPLWSWLSLTGPRLEDVDLDAPYDFETTDVEVRPEPRLITITDVDIVDSFISEDDDGHPTGEYSLSAEFVADLVGDLIVHGYHLDNDGQVQNDAIDVFDVRITSPFLVEIESGAVVAISPAGEAVATG